MSHAQMTIDAKHDGEDLQLMSAALDLHELFEAGGNDPDARTAVLDRVERLVQEGLLEERRNDFMR